MTDVTSYTITGYNPDTQRREKVFTWRGCPKDGIEVAAIEAAKHGDMHFDFQAEVAK